MNGLPITETYRGHRIVIQKEQKSAKGIGAGLAGGIPYEAIVVRIDGRDRTRSVGATGQQQSEPMLVRARAIIDRMIDGP